MGFGQKSFQAPSTNFNAVRYVNGACGTIGNIICATSVLTTGTNSTNMVTINITNVTNINYSQNTLTFTMDYIITDISNGVLLNGCPLSFTNSNGQPTAYANFISNDKKNLKNYAVDTNYKIDITVTSDQMYIKPSGKTTWNINTDFYYNSGSSFQSNSYEILFTA